MYQIVSTLSHHVSACNKPPPFQIIGTVPGTYFGTFTFFQARTVAHSIGAPAAIHKVLQEMPDKLLVVDSAESSFTDDSTSIVCENEQSETVPSIPPVPSTAETLQRPDTSDSGEELHFGNTQSSKQEVQRLNVSTSHPLVTPNVESVPHYPEAQDLFATPLGPSSTPIVSHTPDITTPSQHHTSLADAIDLAQQCSALANTIATDSDS